MRFDFFDPTRVDDVIANMQAHTLHGGYSLIVCAMNANEHPCPLPFSFTFAARQLRDAYVGWEFIKYNEDLGTHNGAQLQFATMLARKPLD